MKYENLQYNTDLVMKFYKNATKKDGYCADPSVGYICPEDIKEAVRRAFHDLTVRTMSRKDKEKTIGYDELAADCCQIPGGLFPCLQNWIDRKTTDFNDWHKSACEKVKAFLKEYYISEDCTVGKAQKIVNMTFKNLYAICVAKGIAEKYEDRFRPCHVPLDSFTLEWFYRNAKSCEGKIVKGKMSNWSAIREYGDEETPEYKEGQQNYYTYYYYQKQFAQWYNGELTPLQAEFVVWSDIQLELAAEGFLFAYKEDIDNKEKETIRQKSLDEKLKDIREKLNT